MGSGRDKKKKKNPKAPGHGAAKTAEKSAKNATKEVRRAEKKLKASLIHEYCACWGSKREVRTLGSGAPQPQDDLDSPATRSALGKRG